MATPKILIVEDEAVTRNTLKGIFEAEGYEVLQAQDGAEMYHQLNLSLIHISYHQYLNLYHFRPHVYGLDWLP